jgi:hypothetical protein
MYTAIRCNDINRDTVQKWEGKIGKSYFEMGKNKTTKAFHIHNCRA